MRQSGRAPGDAPPGLSLEQKAGQVFMLGFPGRDPAGALFAVCDLKAGGIIYFARNTGTVEETSALSAALQDAALSSSGIPLLISADQEGGVVARLTQGIPGMPGPMSLGAAGDPALTQEVSRATAIQLRAAGINMDLAPVLDVNDNPLNPVIGVRSFGGNPVEVSAHGRAAVRGFLESGIAPVGKHFPGHGNTSVDSHLDLPVLPHSMERLRQVELVPFQAALDEGLPAIMTAHIVFRAIDPENPATMSAPVLQGVLRGQMGFKGLIMTDCLQMDAVARDPGTARAAVLALKAGADLLLVSHTRELQEQAYRAVLSAVQSGEVPESRLDDAVSRVLALKRALRGPNPLGAGEARAPRLEALSREAHLRSVTVVRAEESVFPILPAALSSGGAAHRAPTAQAASGSRVRVAVISLGPLPRPAAPGEGAAAGGASMPAGWELARRLSELPGIAAREVLPEEALAAAVDGEVANVLGIAVVLTQNAWNDPGQAGLARRLLDRFPHTIVVAVCDPYDLRVVPAARTFLCTYSPRPEAMEALARVLAGMERPAGRLPVVL